jgi:anti-sigma regulatory factor (Ser/Thr protein kinase)
MNAIVTKSRAQGGAFRWELRSAFELLAELRLQLRAYMAEQAVPAEVAADVVLAVQEASKNAMRADAGKS